MFNIEAIQALNKRIGTPFYLCTLSGDTMQTIHEGRVYDGKKPDWLHDFIKGDTTLLDFEDEGVKRHYFRWNIDSERIVVFLDDGSFSYLYKLMNQLFSIPLQQEGMTAAQMAAEIKSLKEQNADMAVRLKDSLSKNLELSRELRKFRPDSMSPLQNKLLKDGFK
ncbi:MAG: hypothetical protein LBV09_03580 [Deferribacteraceae bacterium]|jgi:hypothetical protein|nr:hypothetical protein [Deferribacteraceae bacterium]